MGGSATGGNVTAVAEFNLWSDPEAAHVVFDAGLPLRVCGLDVTHGVLIDRDFVESIRKIGRPRARFVARLLDTYIATYPDGFVGNACVPLHDPCAVLAVSHSHLFRWESVTIGIELSGTLTRGMSVIDRRNRPNKPPPNADVAVAADCTGILAVIRQAIEST
jgi:pyrimidine-specific ribonucleoside hydrolase